MNHAQISQAIRVLWLDNCDDRHGALWFHSCDDNDEKYARSDWTIVATDCEMDSQHALSLQSLDQ